MEVETSASHMRESPWPEEVQQMKGKIYEEPLMFKPSIMDHPLTQGMQETTKWQVQGKIRFTCKRPHEVLDEAAHEDKCDLISPFSHLNTDSDGKKKTCWWTGESNFNSNASSILYGNDSSNKEESYTSWQMGHWLKLNKLQTHTTNLFWHTQYRIPTGKC